MIDFIAITNNDIKLFDNISSLKKIDKDGKRNILKCLTAIKFVNTLLILHLIKIEN